MSSPIITISPKIAAADTILYKGDWQEIRRTPDGFEYLHEPRCHSEGVGVLLFRAVDVTSDSASYEILGSMETVPPHKASQNEHGLYAITGQMDKDGEEPEDTAVREAMEEAGYELLVEDLISLGEVHPFKGSDFTYYLFAADVSEMVQQEKSGDGSEAEAENYTEWWEPETAVEASCDAVLPCLIARLHQYYTARNQRPVLEG